MPQRALLRHRSWSGVISTARRHVSEILAGPDKGAGHVRRPRLRALLVAVLLVLAGAGCGQADDSLADVECDLRELESVAQDSVDRLENIDGALPQAHAEAIRMQLSDALPRIGCV